MTPGCLALTHGAGHDCHAVYARGATSTGTRSLLVIAGRPGDGVGERQSLHPGNSPGSFKSDTADDSLPSAKGSGNITR